MTSDNCEESVLLEKMSTVDLAMWLQSKGFGAAVQSAFEGELIFASGIIDRGERDWKRTSRL